MTKKRKTTKTKNIIQKEKLKLNYRLSNNTNLHVMKPMSKRRNYNLRPYYHFGDITKKNNLNTTFIMAMANIKSIY